MLWPISMTTRPDSGRTDDIGDPRQPGAGYLSRSRWMAEERGLRTVRPRKPTRKDSNRQAAAQRPDCRHREILDRRVPAGREALEVFQDRGIDPETANDLDGAPAAAIGSHGNSCRSEIGDEMLKSARKPGPDHFFHR